MREQIIDTWGINHRVNLSLLDEISAAGLVSTLSARGGRDVARQFAHMHDVRVRWIETVAPDLMGDLKAFSAKQSPTKADLKRAHAASFKAVGEWLGRSADAGTARRIAMSQDRSALSFTRWLKAERDTPRIFAPSVTLKPCASRQSTRTENPGWGGFFIFNTFTTISFFNGSPPDSRPAHTLPETGT